MRISFLAFCDTTQEETELIFTELRLQKRNVGNELKVIFDKCETDDCLSKEEIKNEKKTVETFI